MPRRRQVRDLLPLLSCIALPLLASCQPQENDAARATAPPHIVFVVADDLGWGDVGFHGGAARTPHLDALREESTELTRCYAYSLCTPTRAALLTGRDPGALDLIYNPLRPWDARGLPLAERTLADRLGAAGYRTALVGKWHLGHSTPRNDPMPAASSTSMASSTARSTTFATPPAKAVTTGSATDRACARRATQPSSSRPRLSASSWITTEPEPLLLFVSFSAPHTPKQAPAELLAHYAQLESAAARLHCAQVEALDAAIGTVLGALDESGLASSTLLVFLSDNGAGKGEGGSNGELRGFKGSAFEGALRVPALLRWPQKIRGQFDPRIDRATSVLDLPVTALAHAGLALDEELDGRLLEPRQDTAPASRALFFAAPWRQLHQLRGRGGKLEVHPAPRLRQGPGAPPAVRPGHGSGRIDFGGGRPPGAPAAPVGGRRCLDRNRAGSAGPGAPQSGATRLEGATRLGRIPTGLNDATSDRPCKTR